MSREILFRGKSIRERKWIEGSLIINPAGFFVTRVVHEKEELWSQYATEVDPSTVCQYTGLTDKNGAKIFENDIVEAYDDEKLICTGAVQLNEHLMMWVVSNAKDKYKNTPLYAPEKLKSMECTRNYIIKGNVFDNPELLEGGTGEDD